MSFFSISGVPFSSGHQLYSYPNITNDIVAVSTIYSQFCLLMCWLSITCVLHMSSTILMFSENILNFSRNYFIIYCETSIYWYATTTYFCLSCCHPNHTITPCASNRSPNLPSLTHTSRHLPPTPPVACCPHLPLLAHTFCHLPTPPITHPHLPSLARTSRHSPAPPVTRLRLPSPACTLSLGLPALLIATPFPLPAHPSCCSTLPCPSCRSPVLSIAHCVGPSHHYRRIPRFTAPFPLTHLPVWSTSRHLVVPDHRCSCVLLLLQGCSSWVIVVPRLLLSPLGWHCHISVKKDERIEWERTTPIHDCNQVQYSKNLHCTPPSGCVIKGAPRNGNWLETLEWWWGLTRVHSGSSRGKWGLKKL
jgi:hypothetical protein